MSDTAAATSTRSSHWKWTICGLLLLASALNYMDRQTLAGASVRISHEFQLTQKQYGQVEEVFGYAFAAGSLLFGWMADRFQVRTVYAAVLIAWSFAGLATGFTTNLTQLMGCRILLGFFEAGHWPCAIRTTRLLLDERQRSFGNGLLQSGASLGAIVTPLLLRVLLGSGEGGWRTPFWVVGAAGLVWIVPWLILVKADDLTPRTRISAARTSTHEPSLIQIITSRRMLILFGVIASINTTWQVLRAWLMKFLQEGRGYGEADALYFNSIWFAAADLGCLAAGFWATRLAVRGMGIRGARLLVFAVCAVLCGFTVLVPWLGRGAPLLIVLAVSAAGALGVFPLYHAFTQDLPEQHQGKITGIAGVAAWLIPARAQRAFGVLADRTGSFDTGLALAALLPLLAWLLLVLFWPKSKSAESQLPPQSS